MVVYEATTDEQLTKIVQFMQAQPPGYATTCFQVLKVIFDIQYFLDLKNKLEGLQIFVCEDSAGAIRVVWAKQIVPNSMHSVVIFGFMAEADYQAGNIQYLKELCIWLIQNESKGIRKHFSNYLTNDTYLKFVQEIFGSALKVLGKMQAPDGATMYQIVIDVKAFKATLGTT